MDRERTLQVTPMLVGRIRAIVEATPRVAGCFGTLRPVEPSDVPIAAGLTQPFIWSSDAVIGTIPALAVSIAHSVN